MNHQSVLPTSVHPLRAGRRLLVLMFAVVLASACSAEDQAEETNQAEQAALEAVPTETVTQTQAEPPTVPETVAQGSAEMATEESDVAESTSAGTDAEESESEDAAAAQPEASAATAAASPYREGTHYFAIQNPDPGAPDVVEVVEVFSYMCPHCATFQPYVSAWHEDLPDNVKFSRIPVSFQPSWQMLAIAYYTAENLGILEESHPAMFRAIHQQNQRFRTMDQLAEFYSQFGVSKERFLSTAQSFAIDSQMRRGEARISQYEISGTPSLVVDGTYRIAAGGALRGYDQLLDVADALIAQELAQ